MAEFPALPLWTDAYLADTRHLSQAEHGAYLLLLMTAWRSPDCSLPDDDRLLARYASCDMRTWRRQRAAIMTFWTLSEGRWRQKRLSAERAYVAERSSKRAEAGRRGGRATAACKRLETRKSGEAMLGVCSSKNEAPTLTPINSIEDLSSMAAAVAAPDPKKAVYDFGKSILGRSSGGQIAKLIQHHRGDLGFTTRSLQLAAAAGDPREYVGAIIRGDRRPETNWDLEYRRMGVS